MNLKNKLDKKKRLNFVKFEEKYHTLKKSVNGENLFYKIYQNLKKNLIYVGFNLKFKGQLYISQALKLINCLVNNFYELKKTYSLNNKNKINLRNPVVFISKRSYRKATDQERSDFYSGKHYKKKHYW